MMKIKKIKKKTMIRCKILIGKAHQIVKEIDTKAAKFKREILLSII